MDRIKQHGARLVKSEKVRFGLVGIANTIVDFAILNILVGVFGVMRIPANVISTTVAMLVSFTLNKKTVFQDTSGHRTRQIVLFFAVTLTSIWVIQTAVIMVVSYALQPFGLPEIVELNVAKVAGICVGLVWNYVMYSRVVFKKDNV